MPEKLGIEELIEEVRDTAVKTYAGKPLEAVLNVLTAVQEKLSDQYHIPFTPLEATIKCDPCDGLGYFDCETCEGWGEDICRCCEGRGTDLENKNCAVCDGYGTVVCDVCGGDCYDEKCMSCDGVGKRDIVIFAFSFVDEKK